MTELISLALAKLFLKISGDASDGLLKILISQYSDLIETYCHRHFSKGEYIETYDGDGSTKLFLNEFPIISIASLSIDSIACDSGDYKVYASEGMIKLVDGSVFTKGNQNVEITYNAGYEAIPADIGLCCAKIVALTFKEIDSDRIGIASQTFGDQNTSFIISQFPEDIKKILNAYKKVLI